MFAVHATRRAWPASSGSPGCSSPRTLGDAATVLLALRGVASRCLPARASLQPRARRRAGRRGHAARPRRGSASRFAHAVLLRDLPARRRDRRRRARRDVPRRHRRLPRRARARHAQARAVDLAEQDGRGPGDRVRSSAIAAVWFAGLYQDWLSGWRRAAARRRGRDRPRRSATCSSPTSSATRGRRTPAACSAPTAARWTAWTPCCSRRSPGTTSGRRCCRSGLDLLQMSDIIPPWPAAVERPPPAVLKLC